jgi:hypothetical protein
MASVYLHCKILSLDCPCCSFSPVLWINLVRSLANLKSRLCPLYECVFSDLQSWGICQQTGEPSGLLIHMPFLPLRAMHYPPRPQALFTFLLSFDHLPTFHILVSYRPTSPQPQLRTPTTPFSAHLSITIFVLTLNIIVSLASFRP